MIVMISDNSDNVSEWFQHYCAAKEILLLQTWMFCHREMWLLSELQWLQSNKIKLTFIFVLKSMASWNRNNSNNTDGVSLFFP